MEIKLFGAERCHKTKYDQAYLDKKGLAYSFLDVEKNERYAKDLRHLYEKKRLNFPTITLGTKTLRNPSDADLNKWIEKLK